MTKAHRLLAQVYGLMLISERCPDCLGPSIAFDGVHLRQWEKLKREIAAELKPEARPN